jgi:hypothetical protein
VIGVLAAPVPSITALGLLWLVHSGDAVYNPLMNTKHGLRGAIVPPGPFKGKEESFQFEGFPIEIRDGVIEIGFNDKGDADRVRDIIRQHLEWFNVAHGVRHIVDLNQSWEMNPDGTKTIALAVSDTIKVSADIRVTKATVQGRARIVTEAYDSATLSTYSSQVQKAQRSTALANALRYFNEEVIDDEKPLYGIYKAVEAVTQALTPPGRKIDEGREALGKLAGHGKTYVDNVMQTAQLTRHHHSKATRMLTDQECKERATILIEAFAKSI